MTVHKRNAPLSVLTMIVLAALTGLAVSGCGGDGGSSGGDYTPKPAPEGTKFSSDSGLKMSSGGAEDTSKAAGDETGKAAPAEEKLGKVPIVIDTSLGKIEAELDGEKAPITVKNFVSYIKKKHYDGTIFHRVIPGFMIQGGGMTPDMEEKPTDAPIKNEHSNGLKNVRGTLSMARTSDPDSATSQFFLSVNDNDSLDMGDGYAVFGKVTKGMDVADKIVAVPTTSKGPHDDVPVEPVMIKSIKIKEGAAK